MQFPNVSILVAARNEEENIADLLHSLIHLSYPKEKLQIIIGNDASTDKTAEIIQKFSLQYPYIQLVNIENQLTDLQGKANVLAQLAHHATGDYFFFTDADIEVPVHWIEKMLENAQDAGIIIGITLVKNQNWFEVCQAIEWLFALHLMRKMTDWKIPSTGMGNNMAVSAEAYWAVGGYEKIGFSIIEDYALYKAIINKGYNYQQLYLPEVMTVTKPPENYFEQRKRWVSGGISSGSVLIFPALIQGFLLPILLIIGVFSWKTPLLVFFLNMIVNFVFGKKIFKILNQERLLKYIPAYTIYMYVFWCLQLVAYFLPTKLVWKGRKY